VVLPGLLAVYGIAVQCVGVYCDDDDWNRQPVSVDIQPERVWQWSDWQVLRAARSGWKGSELLPLLAEAVTDPMPARLEPLTADDLRADVQVLRAPTRLSVGGEDKMLVAVRNSATRAWPAFSGDIRVRYRVFLVVRWLSQGRPVAGTGDVRPLPENISPQETVRMAVPLVAPAAPASYEVELAIAQAFDGRTG